APMSTNVKFYVDGQLDGVVGGALVAIDTLALNDVLIGTDIQNRFFKGTIDEVRIFNRALSAPEIAALYNSDIETVAAWHRRYFGDAPINWSTDDDGDGITRLGEYVFGSEPHVADADDAKVVPEIVADRLRVRFRRRVAETHEISYQLRQSSDLIN